MNNVKKITHSARLTPLTLLLLLTSPMLFFTSAWGLAQGDPAIYMQVSPESQDIPTGGSANFTVSVIGQEGFEGNVKFTTTDPPTGVTVTFDPNPLNVPGYDEGKTNIVVSAAKDTSTGSSTLTITATGVDEPTVKESKTITINIVTGNNITQPPPTTKNITTTTTTAPPTNTTGTPITVTNTTTTTLTITETTTEVITTRTSEINTKTATSSFTQASDITLPLATLIVAASLLTIAGITVRNRAAKTRI
jgi:hypothetical protein